MTIEQQTCRDYADNFCDGHRRDGDSNRNAWQRAYDVKARQLGLKPAAQPAATCRMTLPEFIRVRVSQEFAPQWVDAVTDEVIDHMSDGGGIPATAELSAIIVGDYEDHKKTGKVRYGTACLSDSLWREADWIAQ